MHARLLACLTILCGLHAGCSPTHKCGGALYYDPENVSCRPCPTGARFDDGTCVCPEGSDFMNDRCVGGDPSAVDAGPDLDAAISVGCEVHCDFVNDCLAENELAQGVVPTVITGLHADELSACARACAAVGGDGQLASCIADGREQAACVGDDTQNGLRSSITLLAQCSRAHSDDPLLPLICAGLTQSASVASQIDFCD